MHDLDALVGYNSQSSPVLESGYREGCSAGESCVERLWSEYRPRSKTTDHGRDGACACQERKSRTVVDDGETETSTGSDSALRGSEAGKHKRLKIEHT